MASVINLNRFRKEKARATKEQRAAENRALHGRSKQDRRVVEDARRHAAHELDSKKLD